MFDFLLEVGNEFVQLGAAIAEIKGITAISTPISKSPASSSARWHSNDRRRVRQLQDRRPAGKRIDGRGLPGGTPAPGAPCRDKAPRTRAGSGPARAATLLQ